MPPYVELFEHRFPLRRDSFEWLSLIYFERFLSLLDCDWLAAECFDRDRLSIGFLIAIFCCCGC